MKTIYEQLKLIGGNNTNNFINYLKIYILVKNNNF